RLIQRALLEKGRGIKLEQRTKAESDIAVAAASVLARERFIDWLRNTGKQYKKELPRGASRLVKETAADLIKTHGPEILMRLAKTHFKTAAELAPAYFTKPRLPGTDIIV